MIQHILLYLTNFASQCTLIVFYTCLYFISMFLLYVVKDAFKCNLFCFQFLCYSKYFLFMIIFFKQYKQNFLKPRSINNKSILITKIKSSTHDQNGRGSNLGLLDLNFWPTPQSYQDEGRCSQLKIYILHSNQSLTKESNKSSNNS